jgi:hypothetical protein
VTGGAKTTLRGCPYCGTTTRRDALVCRAHADLPNLDPMLRRPKVQAKPIGVQPFTKDA